MPPLTRKNIAFIVLHDNPQWAHSQIRSEEEFTAKIQIFGLEKTIVYKYEEFNVYRATFVLMRLDDPVEWSVWISQLMFGGPSDQALEPPAFFL